MRRAASATVPVIGGSHQSGAPKAAFRAVDAGSARPYTRTSGAAPACPETGNGLSVQLATSVTGRHVRVLPAGSSSDTSNHIVEPAVLAP